MRRNKSRGLQSLMITFILTLTLNACSSGAGTGNSSNSKQVQAPPYPPSPVIQSITWDFNNLIRQAPGSDLWPITWAGDDNLYTSWGDGGGFGGTDSDGRVSLGFARISGFPPTISGENVWGDNRGHAKNPATFCGKCGSMLSVGGILYAWVGSFYNDTPHNFIQCGPNPNPSTTKLSWSSDLGATWHLSSQDLGIVSGNFLNFGKDYAHARDGFVYIYSGSSRALFLARVPKDRIMNRSSYEFFKGVDSNGNPLWTSDITQRQPFFTDPNGIDSVDVTFNSGIKRFLMTVAHFPPGSSASGVGRLGVFDAPQPWGPWTTVAYYDNWGGFGDSAALGYYIPTKWISADGKTIWVVFSSTGILDSFNLLKATLTTTP